MAGDFQQSQVPVNGGPGSFTIDPGAEPNGRDVQPIVTGKDESDFFRLAAARDALKHNEQNLGWLGKLFGSNGSNSPAATNIAGLVVCASLLFLGLSWLLPHSAEIADFRKLMVGLVSTALAFIFGAATKK